MNPEQQEELEVLQSIYPDSFTGFLFQKAQSIKFVGRNLEISTGMAASHRIRYDKYSKDDFTRSYEFAFVFSH